MYPGCVVASGALYAAAVRTRWTLDLNASLKVFRGWCSCALVCAALQTIRMYDWGTIGLGTDAFDSTGDTRLLWSFVAYLLVDAGVVVVRKKNRRRLVHHATCIGASLVAIGGGAPGNVVNAVAFGQLRTACRVIPPACARAYRCAREAAFAVRVAALFFAYLQILTHVEYMWAHLGPLMTVASVVIPELMLD